MMYGEKIKAQGVQSAQNLSGARGSILGEAAEVRQLDVHTSIQELGANIDILEGAISSLHSRLGGVLRAEDTGAFPVPNRPAYCEVAGCIQIHATRVNNAQLLLNDIMNRLEV